MGLIGWPITNEPGLTGDGAWRAVFGCLAWLLSLAQPMHRPTNVFTRQGLKTLRKKQQTGGIGQVFKEKPSSFNFNFN